MKLDESHRTFIDKFSDDKYDGKQFKAMIKGVPVVGYFRVLKYGEWQNYYHRVYLCQNVFDGREIPGGDKRGMMYSWVIDAYVKDLEVLTKKRGVTKAKKAETKIILQSKTGDKHGTVNYYKGFVVVDKSYYIQNILIRTLHNSLVKYRPLKKNTMKDVVSFGYSVSKFKEKEKTGIRVGCTTVSKEDLIKITSKLID